MDGRKHLNKHVWLPESIQPLSDKLSACRKMHIGLIFVNLFMKRHTGKVELNVEFSSAPFNNIVTSFLHFSRISRTNFNIMN
jgi:hypothetical protein